MKGPPLGLVAIGLVLTGLFLAGQATSPVPASAPLAPDAPFTVAMNTATIEGSPVYVADNGPFGDSFRVIVGGVRSLADGSAHAATNAETQMLIAGTPKVRLLLTVAEGLYRVVAKRSSGIRTLADLRGRKIAVPHDTSAHYYLIRLLASAGVAESEVTLVTTLARDQMAAGVVKGEADAIAMWEPESQNAVDALGSDGIVFQDNTIYRELFSLYSTTDVLNDARRRRELVGVVRSILVAADEVKARPKEHFPVIARTVQQPEERVARSWVHHAFPMAIPGDLVDVMVDEEVWVARNQRRTPRTRAALAALIDASVLAEARRAVRPR